MSNESFYHFFTHRESLTLWTLYFGRQTQAGPNANEVARSVSLIIVHPNFNNTLYNSDIALMKLSSPLTFTNYISPICLASSSSQFFNTTSCWATGWGRINQNGEVKIALCRLLELSKNKIISNICSTVYLPASSALQEVQIPVIGNKQCSCKYIPTDAIITNQMICAGLQYKGTCQVKTFASDVTSNY